MDTESHFMPITDDDVSADDIFLGEGSTSVCYKVKYDGKWYCKKQLKPEFKDSPRYRETLKKEFDLGSQLDSPFIVHYSDFDETRGSYMLTDFVDGLTLADFVKSNPDYFHSRAARRQFVSELLSAVECLHFHQILHLDLKPDNIMITNIGHHVKLIDIGFAYQDAFPQTVGGTEGYSAPEQFCGRFKLGTYSDIYAIGRIFQEYHIVGRHVVDRCLKEKPDERIQSVEELRAALSDRRKYFHLAIILVILFAGVGMWRFGMHGNKLHKSLVSIDSTCKMRLRTLILDTTAHPPLLGCYIDNYDSSAVVDKGILVGTDSDALFMGDNDGTTIHIYPFNAFNFFPTKDAVLIHCPINEEEFNIPLCYLLYGNETYYVKSYIFTSNHHKCVYGPVKTIHTRDFQRCEDKDASYSNVFMPSGCTVFDLMTDEPLNIAEDGCYYGENENPTRCIRNTDTKSTGYYKFKTRWNYFLWYSHSMFSHVNRKEVFIPVMTFRNGMLTITKNPDNDRDSIDIYYTVNGNWRRPENFRLRYHHPLKVLRPCLISCYAYRPSDGLISYTNTYMVFPEQLK